jgi:hypothetical protein
MNLRNTATAGLLLAVSFTLPAQAALHDRGGGLIYDDVLDITWLQDANYAKTSGHDADGKMTWSQAVAWAENLSYGGYNDWRLPTMIDTGQPGCDYANSGTDCGYNVQTYDADTSKVYSELAYMYYVNLGLKGYFNPNGSHSPNFGLFAERYGGGEANVGLVQNLQNWVYWSGLEDGATLNSAWSFHTNEGLQASYSQNSSIYAWAVRPGDITAPVPEPETYALLFAGLGLVGIAARRRKVWLSCCSTHEGVKP